MLQPFLLGGDGVGAIALNASQRLLEALSGAVSQGGAHVPPGELEDVRMSVRLADLVPTHYPKDFAFMVGACLFLKIATFTIRRPASANVCHCARLALVIVRLAPL